MVGKALASLTGSSKTPLQCPLVNVSVCEITSAASQNGQSIQVTVYNPLAMYVWLDCTCPHLVIGLVACIGTALKP